jgi:translation initiation factor eIF-2B subunit delta
VRWKALIEPIRSDKSSGAAEVARKAAATVLEWLGRSKPMAFLDWQADLVDFARALYDAQPAMATLFNLANGIVLVVESTVTLVAAQQRIREVTQGFLRQLEESQGQLLGAALPLVPAGARILTFSHSSSVLAVLLAARARDDALTVFCTESRPMLEGRHLAQRLADASIPVQFGIDAAISTFASQASLVLVGADSITRDGVVNKLGTTATALAAHAAGVPCYVICGRQKWFPAAAPAPDFRQLKPGAEVWPDPPRRVRVWNAYFECTPLELFSGIIGENGLLLPRDLLQQLASMPVAQAWRGGPTTAHE